MTPNVKALTQVVTAMILTLLTTVAHAAPLEVTQTTFTLEGRKVVAWYPTGVDRPLPLVLFSHGYGGINVQSTTLTRAVAGAGYLVLAPNHRDSSRRLGGEGLSGRQASFSKPESWTDKTYLDRRDDLLSVYRSIPSEPQLAKLYKSGPVILMGHSLGGYTALGLAGARSGWSSELKPVAVVALSPYGAPYVVSGALAGLKAPVMYQGGTLDKGITPSVARPGGAYDQTPTAKIFINFKEATHLSWTELRPALQPQIAQYVVAFCDLFAKGQKSEVLNQKLSGVDELRRQGF